MESSNSNVEHIEKECAVLEKKIDRPIELCEENLIKTDNDGLNKIQNPKNNFNTPVVPQYGNYGEESSSASETCKYRNYLFLKVKSFSHKFVLL